MRTLLARASPIAKDLVAPTALGTVLLTARLLTTRTAVIIFVVLDVVSLFVL